MLSLHKLLQLLKWPKIRRTPSFLRRFHHIAILSCQIKRISLNLLNAMKPWMSFRILMTRSDMLCLLKLERCKLNSKRFCKIWLIPNIPIMKRQLWNKKLSMANTTCLKHIMSLQLRLIFQHQLPIKFKISKRKVLFLISKANLMELIHSKVNVIKSFKIVWKISQRKRKLIQT
jgi:hypothetical protein